MKYRNVLSRRTLLRGAGGVAIGLPFLDAMRTTSVFASPPEPPVRVLTFFFGLGLPDDVISKGLTGALEPLAPFEPKLLPLRNLDLSTKGVAASNHEDGPRTVFVGESPSAAHAGGDSLDQILLNAERERDPSTPGSLVAGTYYRENGSNRHIHSWRNGGRDKTDEPIKSPAALFDRVFGSLPTGDTGTESDPARAAEHRARRSVLDAIIAEYQHYRSEASGLGAQSRARIADHLDHIRELEKRVFAAGAGPFEVGV